jgi:hypothetical protein
MRGAVLYGPRDVRLEERKGRESHSDECDYQNVALRNP